MNDQISQKTCRIALKGFIFLRILHLSISLWNLTTFIFVSGGIAHNTGNQSKTIKNLASNETSDIAE